MIANADDSVEQRIATVEVKLADLECAIANLRGTEPGTALGGPKPPRRRRAVPDLSQEVNAQPFSGSIIIPKSSFDSSSTDSAASRMSEKQMSNSAANTLRPTTPAPADDSQMMWHHPSPPAPLPVQAHAVEEFARLMAMLTNEQEARRGLESQLWELQKQINEMRYPPRLSTSPTSHPNNNASASSPKRHAVLPFWTASSSPRQQHQRVLTQIPRMPSLPRNEAYGIDTETETDTDDGFVDVYETASEARGYGIGVDSPRSPPLVGVV